MVCGLWLPEILAIENMPPHFSAHVSYGQMAGWIRIPLRTEVGLGPGDIVLDGNPPPPQKGAQQPSPTFLPMFIVAKLLDASRYHLVGLGPGDSVLDGSGPSSPYGKGHSSAPLFSPCQLWPNGWMDQDTT